MNLSRLVALGLLADRGPMHGHQIRREAEHKKVEHWGGVSVGALYRELHQMEDEGLVVAVRNEQVGRRPARTVYRITEDGARELAILSERALSELQPRSDALGVGLLFGRPLDDRTVGALMRIRRRSVAHHLHELLAERERLGSEGRLSPTDRAVLRRGELALTAELTWHDELDGILGGGRIGTPAPAAASAPAGPRATGTARSSTTGHAYGGGRREEPAAR